MPEETQIVSQGQTLAKAVTEINYSLDALSLLTQGLVPTLVPEYVAGISTLYERLLTICDNPGFEYESSTLRATLRHLVSDEYQQKFLQSARQCDKASSLGLCFKNDKYGFFTLTLLTDASITEKLAKSFSTVKEQLNRHSTELNQDLDQTSAAETSIPRQVAKKIKELRQTEKLVELTGLDPNERLGTSLLWLQMRQHHVSVSVHPTPLPSHERPYSHFLGLRAVLKQLLSMVRATLKYLRSKWRKQSRFKLAAPKQDDLEANAPKQDDLEAKTPKQETPKANASNSEDPEVTKIVTTLKSSLENAHFVDPAAKEQPTLENRREFSPRDRCALLEYVEKQDSSKFQSALEILLTSPDEKLRLSEKGIQRLMITFYLEVMKHTHKVGLDNTVRAVLIENLFKSPPQAQAQNDSPPAKTNDTEKQKFVYHLISSPIQLRKGQLLDPKLCQTVKKLIQNPSDTVLIMSGDKKTFYRAFLSIAPKTGQYVVMLELFNAAKPKELARYFPTIEGQTYTINTSKTSDLPPPSRIATPLNVL